MRITVAISEVVVEDETETPDNVLFVLHLIAVKADDLLRLLQDTLNLLSLIHHVVTCCTERCPGFVIKLEEVGGVTVVTCYYLPDRGRQLAGFYLVVFAEGRRVVVLPSIIKG